MKQDYSDKPKDALAGIASLDSYITKSDIRRSDCNSDKISNSESSIKAIQGPGPEKELTNRLPPGDGRPLPAPKASRSWIRNVQSIYHKKYGGYLKYGFKAMDQVVEEHGQLKMIMAWEAFVNEISDSRFASIGYFLRTYKRWSDIATSGDKFSNPGRYAQLTKQ